MSDLQRFDLDEPGCRGEVRLEGPPGDRRVVLAGVRPQGDDTPISKEISAGRDERLRELVARCESGDATAATEIAGHLGVLDPPALT